LSRPTFPAAPAVVQNLLKRLQRHQRTTYLVASGLSTAGSFAGLTAKGWILIQSNGNPLMLALHFGLLALPSLLLSGPAGVLTDRIGCQPVLIRAQWALFGAAALGALAIPLLEGQSQVALLLLSTLLIGMASSYELTARNKYSALLVEKPEELAPFLASFSVVFNVGKLVGPPLGGWLLALTGPSLALAIDALTYLVPIASVMWILRPHLDQEQRSQAGRTASLGAAWRSCGPTLRHVLRFCALACLVGFFHPGLAPLIASKVVGPSPQALGLFTSVLAAGSIVGGVVLQRNSQKLIARPGVLLGGCTVLTGIAQLGMAWSASAVEVGWREPISLAMAFCIGAGTAGLLASTNLIGQMGAPMDLRGRMAGLSQIAFLGGGGLSGLLAGYLTGAKGLTATFVILGLAGLTVGMVELASRWKLELRSA
jgi:MFS family permease